MPLATVFTQAVSQRWDMDAIRKVGAATPEKRTGYRKALAGLRTAAQLEGDGRAAMAEPLRKLLGRHHSQTKQARVI